METVSERYDRLSKEVFTKYNQYLKAHRKSLKHKANAVLQQETDDRRLEWLKAIQAKKEA
jgi:hypothetical protein